MWISFILLPPSHNSHIIGDPDIASDDNVTFLVPTSKND